jgi:hypothetical protein
MLDQIVIVLALYAGLTTGLLWYVTRKRSI